MVRLRLMSAECAAAEYPTESRAHRLFAQISRERFGFVWGALTNVITTAIAFAVAPYAQLAHLMIIYLLGAVLISTRYGMVVSTFTAITGGLAFDYFCFPPIFQFALPDPHSVINFIGMMMVALLVCYLNQGLRKQRAAARASEARTQVLCELSLDLSRVTERSELVDRAERHVKQLFGEDAQLLMDRAPKAQPGRLVQPVGTAEKTFGYIRIAAGEFGQVGERRLLLAASAERVADALKLLELGEAARRAQVEAELERNRSALLSSVSHDMKTPLASIMTAGSSLLSARDRKGPDAARELLETIVQEAERLNGLITNLLSVTRLESGSTVLSKELEAVDDLVLAALSRLTGRLSGRPVSVDVPSDLPMVSVDPGLFDQLLTNLLENALRYTPSGSPIEITARADRGALSLDVSDRGPGIAAGERELVFDKFYRGQAAKRNDGGTGLGLTICRAVARAHGGDVAIVGRVGGGTTFRVRLPHALPFSMPADPLPERRPTA